MRTILKVSIRNFLSLQQIDNLQLQSLNVLVGPNGSGKTNFLRVFQFLGEVARRDLGPAIDGLDGFAELKFKSGDDRDRTVVIQIEGLITDHASAKAPDEYRLSFYERRLRSPLNLPSRYRRLISRDETILVKRTKGRGRRITLKGGSAVVAPIAATSSREQDRKVSVQSDSSGLSTIRKLGDEYGASQVEALATVFEQLRLFEVDVERARRPASLENASALLPDASNLASYLNWLSEAHPQIFGRLCEDMRFVLPSFVRFHFTVVGGSESAIRVDIEERHLAGLTPLGRASFGTIRAIALFGMLHDPNPPQLTCLEEIDHGLHPHALDRLVERLREASEKTQIIVATHSPALVNRLEPEELVVFERDLDTGATVVVEITADQVREMRDVSGFELGELWFSGSLGGTL